jgi:Fur family ferric uptake transcriptional regulator
MWVEDKVLLKQAGYKLTTPRKTVLEFIKQGEHYSAKDIYEGLNGSLGLTTVYRTLELFVELSLVRALVLLDGTVLYEYVANKNHHHHLVCTLCGEICELDGCAVLSLEREIAKETSYQITNHALELYGICPQCQKF